MDVNKVCRDMVMLLSMISAFVLFPESSKQFKKEFPSAYVSCVVLAAVGFFSALIGLKLPPSTPMRLDNATHSNDDKLSITTVNKFCLVQSFICFLFIMAVFFSESLARRCSQIDSIMFCFLPVVTYYILPCFTVGNLDDVDKDVAFRINSHLHLQMFVANLFSFSVLQAMIENREKATENDKMIEYVKGITRQGDCGEFYLVHAICRVLSLSGLLISFWGMDRLSEWRRRWTLNRVFRFYSGSCFVVMVSLVFLFLLQVPRSDWSFCFDNGYINRTWSKFYDILSFFSIICIPILLYFSPLNYRPSTGRTHLKAD